MTAIWWQMSNWEGDGDHFPPSLSCLTNAKSSIFICPETGHSPGVLTNVDQWTDYIYVPELPDAGRQDVAVLICPPENHGGAYGHVLWGGGWCVRLPPDKTRALIREPWCMPTAARSAGFDQFVKPKIKVQIPEKFRPEYGRTL